MKSIIGVQVLILCIDVLTMLAWLVLATSAGQVDMVGIKTGHTKIEGSENGKNTEAQKS